MENKKYIIFCRQLWKCSKCWKIRSKYFYVRWHRIWSSDPNICTNTSKKINKKTTISWWNWKW